MITRTVSNQGAVPTLCRQCAHHCGIFTHVENGRISKISGNKEHDENRGMVCRKGQVIPEWVYHPARLTGCLKRNEAGRFEPISYNQTLDEIAEKMQQIKENYGVRAMSTWTGEAIGFLQQEEYAHRFINAFGSPNFFTADAVCYASRLMAYVSCQGYWSFPPNFQHSKMIVLWGSNPAHSHVPYMWGINHSRKQGGKLVVIDPCVSSTAKKAADLFLQIRPGTDAALALGLIRILIEKKAYDKEFVSKFSIGLKDLANYVEKFTLEYVADQTGIPEEAILRLQNMMLQSIPQAVSYIGVSLEHQSNGFNTVRAIACLSALCGAIDIEGGEPWAEGPSVNSLSLLNDQQFRDLEPAGYDSFPLFYDVMRKCHSLPGIDYMLGGGKYPIKGLIFSGTNPLLSFPNSTKVAEALSSLDLLVARDLFMTESAKLAHYIVPAASFLERSELHFYSNLQRVALSTKVLDIEGVWDEYTFWHDLAHRLGFGETNFPWKNEEAVNRWILEPSGISLEDLTMHPEGCLYNSEIEYRKFETTPFPTPSGKFEFSSERLKQMDHQPLPIYIPPDYLTSPSSDFPLRMISGTRRSIYYHSRFREIEKFKKAIPSARAGIHINDAVSLGISNGEMIRIVSKTGEVVIEAQVIEDGSLLQGFIEVPHGWNDANVNRLTDDRDVDPVSGFPNMKIVPVRVVSL